MNSSKTEKAYSDLEAEESLYSSDDASSSNTAERLYSSRDTSSTSTFGSTYDFDGFGNINGGVVGVAAIVSFIVAIIAFIFLVQKKKAPRGRFMKWLREYLNFRSILIAGIIKFLYIFLAVLLTIMSVVVMCQGRGDTVLVMILIGLAMMVFGNLFLRIMLELTMAIIMMWENTSDMRAVMVKEEEKPEEKEPKKPDPEPEPEAEPEPEQVAEPTPAPEPEPMIDPTPAPTTNPEEAKIEPVVEETMIAGQQIEVQ